MKEIGRCVVCKEMRPIWRGRGLRYWCKACDPSSEWAVTFNRNPPERRARNRWKLGEKKNGREKIS